MSNLAIEALTKAEWIGRRGCRRSFRLFREERLEKACSSVEV
ncbi:hypothetical protein BASH2_00613 [Bacillus anthracis]|nr:hypothetical protein BASH2_00613 [Bacillus anthracis]